MYKDGFPGGSDSKESVGNAVDVVCVLSHTSVVSDSATLWTVTLQAPLSMGFSREERWSGLPFPHLRGSSRPRD